MVALLLALLGLLVLWQSTVWGLGSVPQIITLLGSISGDIEHRVVYESAVTSFQIAGGILFGVGLWRSLNP